MYRIGLVSHSCDDRSYLHLSCSFLRVIKTIAIVVDLWCCCKCGRIVRKMVRGVRTDDSEDKK